MMITKQDAMTARYFEHVTMKNRDGTPVRARAMGKCQTWKTRPDEFRLPVKYGLKQSFYIDNINAADWSVGS
jgi:hypothetical protein